MAGLIAPRHVGIIMDGNGRWAQNQGKTRVLGHIAGAKKIPAIVKHLFSKGVRVVSLYAFSGENFSRPRQEVEGIFERIEEFIASFSAVFGDTTRLVFSGDLSKVGDSLQRACRVAETFTRKNSPYTLNILLNYGGREEIIRAARLLCGGEIDENAFRSMLYNPDLGDPDLIIRTGGEKRLSGFMPFQSVYSELYFSDVLFPDISESDIDAALEDYLSRNRRFGNIETP